MMSLLLSSPCCYVFRLYRSGRGKVEITCEQELRLMMDVCWGDACSTAPAATLSACVYVGRQTGG